MNTSLIIVLSIIFVIIIMIYCLFDMIYFSIWYKYKYKQDHRILLENLQIFKHCMDECNIFFWLSEGTALGCVRDHSIIKYDSDVDVGIWYEDKEKFMNNCLGMLKSYGFKVLRRYPFSIHRKNNYIDVDFTGYGKKCMAAGIPKIFQSMRNCNIVMDTLEPFHKSELSGDMYYVPSMRYIEKLYGKEWYIPRNRSEHNKELNNRDFK